MADRQGIMAGKAFVEFTLSDAGLVKGLASAQKRLEAFGAGLANVGKKVAGIGLGITAPMIAAAKSFASYGKHLSEVSARTGVAGSSLSELGYAAKETGSSLEDLESGLRTMQLRLLDARGGSETVRKSLAELGLTVDALKKMSPEQQFEAIASALAKIKDPAKQAKLGIEMFGKAGATLKPLFAGGAAAIKALRDEAKKTGAAISQEDIKSAEELDGAFGRLTTSINAMYVRIGAALAPALVEIMDIIQPIVMDIARWLKENRELITTIAKMGAVAVVAGGALYGLGSAMKVAAGGVGLLSLAYAGLKAVVGVFSGGGLLTKAFWLALGAGVLYFGKSIGSLDGVLEWLKDRFGDLKQEGKDVVEGFSSALARGDIEAAVNLFWATLDILWEKGKQDILAKTTSMIFAIEEAFLNASTTVETFWNSIRTEYEKTKATFEEMAAALTADVMGRGDPDLKAEYQEGNIAADEAERQRIKNADKERRDKTQRDYANALNQLDAARAEAVKISEERIRAARKAYDDAIAKAKGPEKPPEAPPPPKPPAPEMDQVDNDKVDERIRQVVGSRAIFGGALAAQVFGGDSFEKKNYEENKRAREAAERMDKRLEQIERNKALTMG